MKKSKQGISSGVWILVTVGLLVVVGIYLGSGRGYGKVSDQSYKYATALYSACLCKSAERLEKISLLIDDEVSDESIPRHERVWLAAIVQRAQDGDWESAARSSKRMMEDQIEY